MSVRPPAVAGHFYPASARELASNVESLFESLTPTTAGPACGAILPHAGYIYSGAVAAAVLARLRIPPCVVLLGPNHTGRGSAAAVDPHEFWETPAGRVAVDVDFVNLLRLEAPSLELDSAAHAREHSLEVLLPLLQARREDFKIVPVCLGEPRLSLCEEIGRALALLAPDPASTLIIASSDMNHYESRNIARTKDAMAFARIQALDSEGLFSAVLSSGISMCGFLPATALLYCMRELGALRVELVAEADSGDVTGDLSSVVAYAGFKFSR